MYLQNIYYNTPIEEMQELHAEDIAWCFAEHAKRFTACAHAESPFVRIRVFLWFILPVSDQSGSEPMATAKHHSRTIYTRTTRRAQGRFSTRLRCTPGIYVRESQLLIVSFGFRLGPHVALRTRTTSYGDAVEPNIWLAIQSSKERPQTLPSLRKITHVGS